MGDPTFERTARVLASTVARIKGQFGGDPAHAGALAEALSRLAEHRLLGHAYAEATAPATEALTLAVRDLAAAGPLGPYTPAPAAARYATAAIHLACLQSAAGLDEAAADTVQPALALRSQVALDGLLSPESAALLLLLLAQQALAGDDPAAANGFADLAGSRVATITERDGSLLTLDLHSALAEARWAAGDAAASRVNGIAALLLIEERLEGASNVARDRILDEATRLVPAVADRARSAGDRALALWAWRCLIRWLPADDVRSQPARSGLAGEFAAAGQDEQAALLGTPPATVNTPAVPERVSWEAPADRYGTAAAGDAAFAAAQQALDVTAREQLARIAIAELATQSRELAEFRDDQDRQRAAALLADEVAARDLEAERLREADRRAERARLSVQQETEQAAARAESKRLRAERIAEHRAEAQRREIERLAGQRSDTKRRPADDLG